MKLQGMITISRPHYGSGKKAIEITIGDKTSWCDFVTVEMEFETFVETLFGHAHQRCLVEFNEKAPIGKKRETKTELVQRPKKYEREEGAAKEAAAILKPFEKDGWKGYVKDLYNHHNWRGQDKVQVSFTRFV